MHHRFSDIFLVVLFFSDVRLFLEACMAIQTNPSFPVKVCITRHLNKKLFIHYDAFATPNKKGSSVCSSQTIPVFDIENKAIG